MLQLIYFLIFLNITYTSAVQHQPEKSNIPTERQHEEKQDLPVIKSNVHISKDGKDGILPNKTSLPFQPTNPTRNVNASTNVDNNIFHASDDIVQSGALLRGFYVLLGITFLFVIYLGFRMYRTGKGNKPPVRVRKYGVLTNRGDVEMLPLPLSEDEDDDTVFELNNHVNR